LDTGKIVIDGAEGIEMTKEVFGNGDGVGLAVGMPVGDRIVEAVEPDQKSEKEKKKD